MLYEAYNTTINDNNEITFLLDSAASTHMVNDFSLFTSFHNEERTIVPALKNKTLLSSAKGMGTISFQIETNKGIIKVLCHNTLYVPELRRNLLSVGQLLKRNIHSDFKHLKLILNNKQTVPIK